MNVGNVSDAVRNGLVRNGDGNRALHLECEPWLGFSLESGFEKALRLPVLATPRAHRACVCFGRRMGPSVLCSVTPAFLFLSTRGWASWWQGLCLPRLWFFWSPGQWSLTGEDSVLSHFHPTLPHPYLTSSSFHLVYLVERAEPRGLLLQLQSLHSW